MVCVFLLRGYTQFCFPTGWTQMWLAQSSWLFHPHTVLCVHAPDRWRSEQSANITWWTSKALCQVTVGCWIVRSLWEKCHDQALDFQAGLVQQLVGSGGGRGQPVEGMGCTWIIGIISHKKWVLAFGVTLFWQWTVKCRRQSWWRVNLTLQIIQLMIFFYFFFVLPLSHVNWI